MRRIQTQQEKPGQPSQRGTWMSPGNLNRKSTTSSETSAAQCSGSASMILVFIIRSLGNGRKRIVSVRRRRSGKIPGCRKERQQDSRSDEAKDMMEGEEKERHRLTSPHAPLARRRPNRSNLLLPIRPGAPAFSGGIPWISCLGVKHARHGMRGRWDGWMESSFETILQKIGSRLT